MTDSTERVAIVGVAGVFPGAPDLERFWQIVRDAVDATGEVPKGRWSLDPADAFDPQAARPDHVYSTRGGFVEGFTPDLDGLNVDPDLVGRLDPSFGLALHAANLAWRDAKTDGLDRSRVAVVFGNIVLPTEAASALAIETLGRALAASALGHDPGPGPGVETHPLNRHAAGLPAGLVATALGLGGGGFTLDAACASSLYALKLAADELTSGRADAVITGGVSRPDPLYTQMGFSQLRALSAAARPRPFEARGDGLVVGEGAGMFVLKRVNDAVRQGDHIYGIVAAVGLSNDVDGGLLAPNSEGQLRSMRSAYTRAGWNPADVGLIECHATGTPVGDAVEFASLAALWADAPASARSVLGSHKSNFGHSLTAAGAAGLIKVLLAFRHQTLPPTAGFEAPSPKIPLSESPFRVLTAAEPWPSPAPGRPRRAAVSGFGFGGINAHALIEEYVPQPTHSSSIPAESDEPIAIVGLGVRHGPWCDVSAFERRAVFGDAARPSPPPHDWGLADTDWAPKPSPGFHLDHLEVPLDQFRIPPRELEEMLPQQTLALLAAADAIADAGWPRDRPRLRAGVFVGIGLDPNTTNFHVRWQLAKRTQFWNDSLGLGLSSGELDQWTDSLREAAGPALNANRTMGALGGLVASRIAREFRVGGPSFTISSEETSGLRALDVAVNLLRRGELDEALVAAVDLTGDPRVTQTADRLGAGVLPRGDGATALVLKRLSDATRDSNHVYAVIHRSVPSSSGPAGASSCSVESASQEFGTLVEFITSERSAEVASASAQSLVGHAGAAAGLTGLVRAVLCLDRRLRPTSNVGPRYWLTDLEDGPRAARVEASAVDGTGFIVELAEHARPRFDQTNPISAGPLPRALLPIAADTPDALLHQIDLLESLAVRNSDLPAQGLADLWWSATPPDPSARLGLALLIETSADLNDALAQARQAVRSGIAPVTRPGTTERVIYNPTPLGPGALLALVFPGIGNQFPGMGRDLSAQWPGVFDALSTETTRLRTQLEPGSDWDGSAGPAFEDHRAPILAQIVLGTAVADLLRGFGVRPDAVLGYSLGESAALFATRAWTGRDAMHARLDASPLFRTDLCGPCDAARLAWDLAPDEPVDWAAGIVPYPADVVRKAIARDGLSRAYLLIINTPRECVIGGQRCEVVRLAESLGGLFVPLPVVSTVHCEVARRVEPAYRALHTQETVAPAGLRFYSAGWGRSYIPDKFIAADAIVAQAMDTVDFPAVVRRAHADGFRLFVEVGPGGSCTRMIDAILGDQPHLARSACVPGVDGVAYILDLLARLFAERAAVDLAPLYRPPAAAGPGRPPLRIPVGGSPFRTPPPPRAIPPRDPVNQAPEACPPVPERTIPTAVFERRNGTPPTDVYADIAPPSDEWARQLLATQTARGLAHGAFLQNADGLGRTMSNHLSFQIALLDALSSAAGPALAEPPRFPVTDIPRMIETKPRPVLDRDACLEFAVGSIGKVLGPAYAAADAFPTRVRLPDEPLMLVDRITLIEGEALALKSGRVVTEHDVLAGNWYLDHGRIPTCIAVESGQADLFLSGWLGIDLETKGEAVYRLLDAVVTFHDALPGPGAVIRYDIHISEFFRQGDTYLFRFYFDATVDGRPLLTMRDGCAGFFGPEELAAGKGILKRALDLRPLPGKLPADWSPPVPTSVGSFDDAAINALRRGDYPAAFGPLFEGLGLADPARLPGGLLALIDRVSTFDPTGGRFGLGLIRGELDVRPDAWFLACHFVDDQVMPGTLMYECCLHTLRVFLARSGWVGETAGLAFEPVPGVASRLRCRGQVTASTRLAVFEVVIKELGYGPEPFAIADALMYADGKPVVEVVDMSIRITGLDRPSIERLWAGRHAPEPTPALNSRAQIVAFAEGKPSAAFGPRFRPFDGERFMARLPREPYSFLDRVVSSTAEPCVARAGADAIGEYDVPPDAWYFDSERTGVMPFAVLIEIPLQVCGWLSAYFGAALTSDEDLAYRNLGGEGTVYQDVTPATGTLRTRVVATKVANSGGMILHHFDFETTTAAGDLVYRGNTYFGFFRRQALAHQVGIRDTSPYALTPDERARARALEYPGNPPFPDDTLRMIERVTAFVPDGGPHGLGVIEGTLVVNPSAWFFQAHFFQDPVCPGSLGLESFQQLLKVVAVERWGEGADGPAGFESIGLGQTHRWLYRGQVVPADHAVTVSAVVTEIDDAGKLLRADGFLSVDGRLIYRMDDFTLRMRTAQ